MILNPRGEKKWTPSDDPRRPFCLLAVVNRLDLAGDWDRRTGGHFAGEERRWFGEGRLVYGITRDREDGSEDVAGEMLTFGGSRSPRGIVAAPEVARAKQF